LLVGSGGLCTTVVAYLMGLDRQPAALGELSRD
jgi:hypothetical protein